MKKNLLFSVFKFLFLNFILSFPSWNRNEAFSQQNLPVGFAPGEEMLMNDYLLSRPAAVTGITTPPFSSVRSMAEWEEIQAITVTWTNYTATLTQLVKIIQEECNVIINCTDSNAVKNTLSGAGIPPGNIGFIQQPFNTIWIRDYGPLSVYTNEVDSLLLVDWIYNRPRPKDDTIPAGIAKYLNVPLYQTLVFPYNLMNTGGNFMSDGFGNAFASKLVLDENDGNGSYSLNYPNHTESEIDSIMKDFMGINRYIKMNTLPYDGIHHIDMHMKLLDEETLLVGEYPQGTADGPQIEANIQYVLSNFQSMFGTPYKIVRVVQPPDADGKYPSDGLPFNPGDYRNYANSVIANKKVIIPFFEEKYDTVALRIYRENMPGYDVVGVDCNQIIQASGALHCITHEIGVSDPLLISHQSLQNTTNTTVPYQVDAYINHKSGIASASLFYTNDTSLGFAQGPMGLTDPQKNTWTGFIVEMPAGTTIYYYIEATANSGKTRVRPLTAPAGFWKFQVESSSGTEELPLDIQLKPAFPNPAGAITCIPVISGSNQEATIKLYDILGKEVLKIFDGAMKQGENNFFFNAEPLAQGAYLLVLESEEEKKYVQKLMIK